MTKQELYEKLGGIYGGQKELIDDVVDAFDELQKENIWLSKKINNSVHVNDYKRLKHQNDALINALTLTRQKYNNDKARYRKKYKMYRTRINKAKKYMYENMIDIVDKDKCYWNMVKEEDVELILDGKKPFFIKAGDSNE